MATRKPSAPRNVAAAGVGHNSLVAYDAKMACDIALGLNGLQAEASALKAAFDLARGKQLPFMIAALKGVQPVTAQQWADNYGAGFAVWAKAQGCVMSPDGKALKGGKVSAYAATSYSIVKVATIALTNGIAPLKGESLQGYVVRARPICAGRGLIEVRHTSEKLGGSGKAGREKAGPEKAGPEKARASALRIVANNDHPLADAIAFATSEGQVDAFKAWVTKRMAAIKALEED